MPEMKHASPYSRPCGCRLRRRSLLGPALALSTARCRVFPIKRGEIAACRVLAANCVPARSGPLSPRSTPGERGAECLGARKATSRIERRCLQNRIGIRPRHACMRQRLRTRLPVGLFARNAEEGDHAERIDVAPHARLPKAILFGRSIQSRAEPNGIRSCSLAIPPCDAEVDERRGKP